MASEPSAFRRDPIAWIPAVAIILLFAWRASDLFVVVDDAYISFRYAENLARHGELVYNLGERVEGYTNPLWTLGLAASAWLGVSPPKAAVVAGAVFALAALGLVFEAARRSKLPLAAGLFATALVAINTSYAFWAVAGLESALFAFLLIAAWLCFDSEFATRPARSLALCMLAALAALTRIEGAALALAAPILLAWRGARGRALWLSFAGPMLVLAHLLWRHGYYGAWLPNPVTAKLGFGVASLVRGAKYVASGLLEDGGVFFVPLILASLTVQRGRWLAAAVALYLAFIVIAGGDGLYRYRFLAHVMPAIGLLVAIGIGKLAQKSRQASIICVALALAGGLFPLTRRSFFRGAGLEEVREWEVHWKLVGQAIGQSVPKDALLSTNVAGRVPYFSGLPTLDLLGLTDPVVARAPVRALGTGYAGHERAEPEYVVGRKPDLIYVSVLDGLPEALFKRPNVLRQVLAQGSLHGYAVWFDEPGFTAAWRPAFVTLSDGRHAGILVRVGGKAEAGIKPESWQE